MRIDALLNPLTVVTHGWQTLVDVANRMRFNDVGSAAVLDGDQIVGIITERDLTRAIADGADPQTMTVADYMTPEPAVISPTTDAREAARYMVDLGVRHLPVAVNGRLVGLISMRDVLLELVWTPEAS
jgi:CBS domain-containing protein